MRNFIKMAGPSALLLGMLSLSGCGSAPTQDTGIYNPETAIVPPQQVNNTNTSGTLFTIGKGNNSGPNAANEIQVNAYLWRASLDSLAFMPLVSADPFGGVIITDWYIPSASPTERFKVNAYILSKQLTANAVQVSVFQQTNQNGQWIDTPASPAIAAGLEDRILAQAADLQAEAQHTR